MQSGQNWNGHTPHTDHGHGGAFKPNRMPPGTHNGIPQSSSPGPFFAGNVAPPSGRQMGYPARGGHGMGGHGARPMVGSPAGHGPVGFAAKSSNARHREEERNDGPRHKDDYANGAGLPSLGHSTPISSTPSSMSQPTQMMPNQPMTRPGQRRLSEEEKKLANVPQRTPYTAVPMNHMPPNMSPTTNGRPPNSMNGPTQTPLPNNMSPTASRGNTTSGNDTISLVSNTPSNNMQDVNQQRPQGPPTMAQLLAMFPLTARSPALRQNQQLELKPRSRRPPPLQQPTSDGMLSLNPPHRELRWYDVMSRPDLYVRVSTPLCIVAEERKADEAAKEQQRRAAERNRQRLARINPALAAKMKIGTGRGSQDYTGGDAHQDKKNRRSSKADDGKRFSLPSLTGDAGGDSNGKKKGFSSLFSRKSEKSDKSDKSKTLELEDGQSTGANTFSRIVEGEYDPPGSLMVAEEVQLPLRREKRIYSKTNRSEYGTE